MGVQPLHLPGHSLACPNPKAKGMETGHIFVLFISQLS